MASHELVLAFNVVDIAITGSGPHGSNTRIAVLHSGGICLYEWKLQERLPSIQSLLNSTELPSDIFFQSISQQVVFMGNHSLLVWHTGPEGSILSTFAMDENIMRYAASSVQNGVRNLIAPAAIVMDIKTSDAYILLNNNEVRGANSVFPKSKGQDPLGGTKIRLPTFTPRIEVVEYHRKPVRLADSYGNGSRDIDQAHLLTFGLADNGSLYANDRLLTRNCTSFLVTAAHLIFTTTQHLVKFVHMVKVEGMNTVPTIYINAINTAPRA